MTEIKTSRALSSVRRAFRIELKKVYNETHYDLIWQANGADEEIAILLDKKDLKELKELIELTIIKQKKL